MNFKKSDKQYTHIFFSNKGSRGVYILSTGKIKEFEMSDKNFKNPAKLLGITGMNCQLYVTIDGSDMTVKDMYYLDGDRFFTEEEITKYCTGMKWKYEA